MRLRKKTVWRLLALLALVILAAGLLAPHLSVNRFARRVRESLETALGRQVELGEVHLNLFTGPGFSVSRVVIHEDPRFSQEPLAYIGSLEARIRFRSLWAGRLEFSNLRLSEPSINLAKTASGEWNFEPLLSRAVGAAAQAGPRFPNLQVRGGRINFKFGDLKSVYYLTDPELDISPPAGPEGDWRMRFSGEPARTDRPALGFGRFSGRGRWRPDPRTGGNLALALELENSPISELIALLHGHDIGVHGRVSSSATLSGPASALEIGGRLQIQDLYRWNLLPPRGEGWRVDYRGRLDLVTQRLELETFSPSEPAPPLAFRVRARDYLSQPRWGALATLDKLPLAPLVEVARHMGVALPARLVAEGDLTGVVGYSPETGLQGRVACPEAALKTAEAAGLRLRRAEVVLERDRARLLPATVSAAANHTATLQGEFSFSTQVLEGSLQSGPMRIADLTSLASAMLGPVPLLEHSKQGSWQGRLNYRGRAGQPLEWDGTLELSEVRLEMPGFNERFEIQQARAMLREGGALLDRIEARVGGIEIQGQYRYLPKAARPHQVQFFIPKLDVAELERLLLSTLRRPEGLLARTMRLGRARDLPSWLAERQVEGAVEIGSLRMGELAAQKLRARLRWDGAQVEVHDLEVRFGAGSVRGKLAVDLRRAVPAYRFTAQLRGISFSGGRWDGEGSFQTEGSGAELWRNLRAQAAFSGRALHLGPEAEVSAVSGNLQLTVARGVPRLRLTDLEAEVGEETLRGQGATDDDGRLHLELSDGRRTLRATATLDPKTGTVHSITFSPPLEKR